jgi:hypothetical protein
MLARIGFRWIYLTNSRRYHYQPKLLEAALEKMAGAAFSPVNPASIEEGEILQTA